MEVQDQRREVKLAFGESEAAGGTVCMSASPLVERRVITGRTSSSRTFLSMSKISSSLLSPVRSISTLSFEPRAFASFAGGSVPYRVSLRPPGTAFEAGAELEECAGDLADLRNGEGEAREEGSLTSRFLGVGSLRFTIVSRFSERKRV